jgi:hypothetical protein
MEGKRPRRLACTKCAGPVTSQAWRACKRAACVADNVPTVHGVATLMMENRTVMPHSAMPAAVISAPHHRTFRPIRTKIITSVNVAHMR